jgi:large subunit ribosomal protein L17
MRHGKKFNHLGRKKAHRKALLMNLSNALIDNKRIFTTLAKAKALRKFVEPLITKSKTNDTHNRRTVFSHLRSKNTVTELFDVVASKIGERPGGYTRIIKTGFRQGDSADMAMIELVDFNETYTQSGDAKKATKKRSRRGGSKKAATTEDTTSTTEEVATEE